MTPNMISACERHVGTYMQQLHPDVPVVFTGQAVPKHAPIYVRFYVVPSEEVVQMSLGPQAKSRNVGLVHAAVIGPKDEGAGDTGEIAEHIRIMFHRVPLEVSGEGWVKFKDGGVVDAGDKEEEHMVITRVPYEYDFLSKTLESLTS
ncbi:hypothetical protein RPALISO_59 [Ruegeria phage RpAliso]|nr:hypothetical protein RPALISO_59 [Ruegeria phage RpAliso]